MRETRCVISGKRNHVRTDAAAFSHREYLCAFWVSIFSVFIYYFRLISLKTFFFTSLNKQTGRVKISSNALDSVSIQIQIVTFVITFKEML